MQHGLDVARRLVAPLLHGVFKFVMFIHNVDRGKQPGFEGTINHLHVNKRKCGKPNVMLKNGHWQPGAGAGLGAGAGGAVFANSPSGATPLVAGFVISVGAAAAAAAAELPAATKGAS